MLSIDNQSPQLEERVRSAGYTSSRLKGHYSEAWGTTATTTERTSFENLTSRFCNISRLFQVVWLAKCLPNILELNWYDQFGDKLKQTENLSSSMHGVHTSTKQVTKRRGKNKEGYVRNVQSFVQRAKSEQNTVFQVCKCLTFSQTSTLSFKTDSVQSSSNTSKNYLLKIYSQHGNFFNAI